MEGEFDPKAFLKGRTEPGAGTAPAVVAETVAPVVVPTEVVAPVVVATPSADVVVPPTAEEKYQLILEASHAKKLMELVGISETDPLTADTLLDKLTNFQSRDQEVTNMLIEKGVYDSPELRALNSLKAMDAESFIKQNLLKLGYTETEAIEEIESFIINGTLERQYVIHARQIDAAINAENEKLKEQYTLEIQNRKKNAEAAKSPEQIKEYVNMFKEHLKADSIAGIKLGKTAQEADNMRLATAEYCASGKFESELKANPSVYAEMAFVFKNFDTVKATLLSEGKEAGKASILEKIMHPNTPSSAAALVPKTADSFDPGLFTQGRAAAQQANAPRKF